MKSVLKSSAAGGCQGICPQRSEAAAFSNLKNVLKSFCEISGDVSLNFNSGFKNL